MSTAGAKHDDFESSVCRNCDLLVFCRPSDPLFDLPPPVRIARHRRTVRAGDPVFRMGEPCHSLCAICEGSARRSVISPDGGMQVTGFQFSGDLIGADALGEREFRHDVVAMEPVTVCEIGLHSLEDACKRSPGAQRGMLRLLGSVLALNQELMVPFLGKTSAAARIAAFLTGVADRLERRGLKPEAVALHMPRADLANYLGIAKETVSRVFTRFGEAGVLRLEQRRYWLTNRALLAEQARCPDSAH